MAKKVDAKAKVIELIEGMTVLELSELVKALEEKFGVSAVPAGVQAIPVQAGVEAEKVVEEKTEFDVILKSFGDKKIPVIKAVREVTELGLKEAKDLVDGVPCTVREKLSKDEAEKIVKKIEAAGGVCEVR